MNLRKIIILTITLIILISCILSVNISTAAAINKADLYSKGVMEDLLKLGDVTIVCDFVVYKQDGVEYPAYCLDKDVQGVTNGNGYSVSVNDLISSVNVWKAIINGYPYKSAKELGCDNNRQAYLATKQAVYCMIYNRDPNLYKGIGTDRSKVFKCIKENSSRC
jgi:hypothetical protein